MANKADPFTRLCTAVRRVTGVNPSALPTELPLGKDGGIAVSISVSLDGFNITGIGWGSKNGRALKAAAADIYDQLSRLKKMKAEQIAA